MQYLIQTKHSEERQESNNKVMVIGEIVRVVSYINIKFVYKM